MYFLLGMSRTTDWDVCCRVWYHSAMHKTPHYIVVGSGLAGATFIAAQAHTDCRITLLERETPAPAKDERPISLSYATVIFLRNVGIWEQLASQAGAINTVHVSEQGRFGSLQLNASDAALPALGYVVPFNLLSKTVYDHAVKQATVTRVPVHDLTQIKEQQGVQVMYQDDAGTHTITGDYLVAADGMHSRCRELLHIGVTGTTHHDMALTALLTFADKHSGVAYERFIKNGVLALLPMWGHHQYRMVWTLPKKALDVLTDEDLIQSLHANFASRLGPVRSLKRLGAYPLTTSLAKQQVTQHAVLLGDSAHRIYPLAAQGYNLTVRDCASLVDVFSRGDTLADYEEARKTDQRFISRFTQSLEWVFGLQLPLLDHLRATALFKMDLLPPLKRQLIQKILGRDAKQPELLCED